MKIISCLLTLIILVVIPFQGCRRWIQQQTAKRVSYQDDTHLTFLGLAIANYTDVNKKLPSNITDKEGKPLLSWRVELLKSGSSADLDLYKKFKLDEPWNSPHNMKVALTVPFMYIDPKGPKCTPISNVQISPLWQMDSKALNYTPYLAVIGPKTAFNLKRLPNKDAGYAAVVVIDKSDVFWTEPRDISLEKVNQGEILRFYGNTFAKYLTPRGGPMSFKKDSPPNYEFESDD